MLPADAPQILTLQTAVINDYFACAFDGVEKFGWEDTYVEFIDVSGLAKSDEYELIVEKHNLIARIKSVPEYVKAQRECVRVFSKYHPEATRRLAKKGHTMPDDMDKADAFLVKVLSKEKMFITKLRETESKLEKLKHPGGYDNKKARRSFVRLLNTVGQRYKIDREKTTLEELALMILELAEEAEQAEQERISNSFKNMR